MGNDPKLIDRVRSILNGEGEEKDRINAAGELVVQEINAGRLRLEELLEGEWDALFGLNMKWAWDITWRWEPSPQTGALVKAIMSGPFCPQALEELAEFMIMGVRQVVNSDFEGIQYRGPYLRFFNWNAEHLKNRSELSKLLLDKLEEALDSPTYTWEQARRIYSIKRAYSYTHAIFLDTKDKAALEEIQYGRLLSILVRGVTELRQKTPAINIAYTMGKSLDYNALFDTYLDKRAAGHDYWIDYFCGLVAPPIDEVPERMLSMIETLPYEKAILVAWDYSQMVYSESFNHEWPSPLVERAIKKLASMPQPLGEPKSPAGCLAHIILSSICGNAAVKKEFYGFSNLFPQSTMDFFGEVTLHNLTEGFLLKREPAMFKDQTSPYRDVIWHCDREGRLKSEAIRRVNEMLDKKSFEAEPYLRFLYDKERL